MNYKFLVAITASIFLPVSLGAEEVRGCSDVHVRAVSTAEGWALMRDDGKILTTRRYCNGGEYSDGLVRFDICEAGGAKRFAYVNTEGKEILTIDASVAKDFSEGLVPIETDKNLWGYMDKQGKTVISPQFENAGAFSEGLAPVETDLGWRYIDKAGQPLLRPNFDPLIVFQANPFSGRVAFLILRDPSSNTYLKGLIDRSGKLLFPPRPDIVGPLKDGLMPIRSSNNKIGFVNEKGNFVIEPQFADLSLLPFEEGLAAVYNEIGGKPKAGFIDTSGKWQIEPKFQAARHFCGGLAPVKANGKWEYIDKTGEMIIAPAYEDAGSFDGGIAEVNQSNPSGEMHVLLIDRKGSLLYRSETETKVISIDH